MPKITELPSQTITGASIVPVVTSGVTGRTTVSGIIGETHLKHHGAVGDGTTDDTAALTAALLTGLRVVGDRTKTYAVTGNQTLPANTWLQDVNLKQLTPTISNCRTLTSSSVNNITLIRVKVNRNGSASTGSMLDDAGIYLVGGSNHLLEDCEVTGNNKGTGISIVNASDFHVVRPYVHDMAYNVGSAPTDDVIQGIWFSGCTNFTVDGGRVENLGGEWPSQSFLTRWSRGFVFGGCTSFTVTGADARSLDQGFDLTGSEGNTRFTLQGCRGHNNYTWSFKFANTARDGRIIGCHDYGGGYAGFVISGPTEASLPVPMNLTFIGCSAKNTGSVTSFYNANNPSGFLILEGTFDTSYPRGVRFIGCEAIDESTTMRYGFRNQIIIPAGTTVYDYNEAIHCTVRGSNLLDEYSGFHAPATMAKRNNSPQSISNNAWNDVNWDTEQYDYGEMHNDVSTNNAVYIRRAGLYLVTLQASFAANATGSRKARLSVNSVDRFPEYFTAPTAGTACRVNGSATYYFNAGDVLVMQVFQDSGGALNLRYEESFFSAVEIGPYGVS